MLLERAAQQNAGSGFVAVGDGFGLEGREGVLYRRCRGDLALAENLPR